MSFFSHIDFSQPDWYLNMEPIWREYFWDYEKNKDGRPREWYQKRKDIVKEFAELYTANKLTFGEVGENHDEERKPIDTIVIHHTHTDPSTTLEILEAYGIIRIYGRQYSSPSRSYYKQPLWTKHFYNGKQTFVAYHYLIWPEGTTLNPLKDEYIGWHAGNWDINCRSIGIAFVDNLDEHPPTDAAVAAAKKVLANYPNSHLSGHFEVQPKTACPGPLFLNGWKSSLL